MREKGGVAEMGYIRKTEEAIEVFEKMPHTIKDEHMKALQEMAKENEVVAYLLEQLLDESVHEENFHLAKSVAINSSYERLVNYHSFKTSIEKMKNQGKFDTQKLAFALRNTDIREQMMYRAIIQGKIELGPPVAQAIHTNKNSTTILAGNQGTVETRIEPKEAPQDVEVISMDTDVATVELLKEGKNKKVWSVKGVGKGTTILLFSTEADPAISKEVKVTVNAPEPITETEDK